MNVTGTWKNYWQIKHTLLEGGGKKKTTREGRGRSAFQECLNLKGSPGSWNEIILSSTWMKMQENQIDMVL